ncbi:MAG: hypothetical protein ABWY12_12165 [Burkholderiales bacterium]
MTSASRSKGEDAWQAFETAPKDGTVFLALNHDHEVWVCKFIDDRIVYRTNGRYEPRKFTNVTVDGETLLREDVQFAKDGECWRSDWTFWSRLYRFAPICWLPLPKPPAHLTDQEGQNR